MDNAFLGKNGLQWWVGVVEDNKDPLRVYRCRVRIFGWHTEDKNLIPSEDLPWAQASLPVNNSLTFSVPQIGEWVHGHFLDGEAGQFPIYTGVLPGVISPNNIKNPNKGFNSAQTKGPSPAKTIQAKDGSGSVSKSDPFVSFPKVSSIPTTNFEAMHLDFAKPQSVTDQINNKLNDIMGPAAASVGDKIKAAVLAVAATAPPPTKIEADGTISAYAKCGPTSDSLIGDIGKLIQDGKDLLADTENFINESIDSAAASAASSLGITDGLNTISGAIDSAGAALSKGLDTMKAAAEKELAKQKENLEATARKYEKMAKESLDKTLDDLKLESGSVGCYLLNSISPSAAGITTKLPVVVDEKTKTSKAVVGAVTYPLPMPHDLPAAIPLSQIPSSHEKSLENSISTWKSSINVTFPILLESLVQIESSYSSNIFSSGGTVDRVALNTMKYYFKIWTKLKTQKNSIAEAYGKPEVLSKLETYIKPYDDQIKVAANKIPEI